MECLKQLTSWLFNPRCVLCHQLVGDSAPLCSHCLHDLPVFAPDSPLNLLQRPDVNRLFTNPVFDRLLALGWYQPPFSNWLSGLKFHNNSLYAATLRQLITFQLARYISHKDWHWPDAICLLPLHRNRYIWRGFNQVAVTWGACLPTWLQQNNWLQRTKATRAQSQLTLRERKKNMVQAFHACPQVENKIVAVVDDVITTGASLNAAARTLKRAGAAEVHAWVTCITPKA